MKIIPISLFRLGSAYNYVPDVTDTGIRGNTIYEGVMPTEQAVVEEGSYSVHADFVAEDVFSFGEIGIYDVGGRLLCLEAYQNEITVKLGNTYRVTVTFFDATLVSYSAQIKFEEVESIYTYDGEYSVTPTIEGITLETAGLMMKEDLAIQPIPTYSVSNQSGTTFIIGRIPESGTD